MSPRSKHRILLTICLIALAATGLAPRIGQDPAYHLFADEAALFAIPNALNVLTNLLFVAIGLLGLDRLVRQKKLNIVARIHMAYLLFFAALVLIGLGSAYYHWAPDNQALTLDRLPMSVGFMSFFTILIGERISPALARRLFPLLLLAGVASIIYWHGSELAGRGDLRPYALVQYLPALLVPVFLLMYESRYDRNSDIWWFLFCFVLSKLCEVLDREIYDLLVVLSGHSLKHVVAAIGCYIFLRHLQLRRVLQT